MTRDYFCSSYIILVLNQKAFLEESKDKEMKNCLIISKDMSKSITLKLLNPYYLKTLKIGR